MYGKKQWELHFQFGTELFIGRAWKVTIFIKCFQKQICNARMFNGHMVILPAITSSATHYPPSQGPAESAIASQFVYLKSSTYKSS